MAPISKIRGITFLDFAYEDTGVPKTNIPKKVVKKYHCVFLISQKGLLLARLRDLLVRPLPKAWKQKAFPIQGVNYRDPCHFLTQ